MAVYKKTLLWTLGSLLFIACILFAAWRFFKKDLANPKSKIAKPLLTNQIKNFINKASDGLYQVKYGRFDLNIDSGKGLITNLNLKADTAVYRRLLQQRKAPNNVLSLHIDTIKLDHFGFIKTDSGRRFAIAGITIKNSVMTISNKRLSYNDSAKTSNGLVKHLLKDVLNLTSVKRMNLHNMTLVYINRNELHLKRTVLKRLNLSLSDIDIAKLGEREDTAKRTGSAIIKAGQCIVSTPDSLYRLIISDMRLFPEKRSAYMAKFVLQPRLNKVAFYRKSGFNRDRFHFIYKRLAIKNIDIPRLLNRQQLHIGSMTAGSSWHEIYNNYHWPNRLRPVRQYVYPHERLQLLAFDIRIDTIKTHNGYLQYAIAAKKSKQTAKLFLTNIESTVYNLTNNTLQKKRNPYLLCYSDSRMMGTAHTRTKYKFNLESKSGAFSASIHMGRMDAKAINPLAAPLGLIAVRSGTIDQMNMYLKADEQTAKGNIDLYYHDLKINLLKRDDQADSLKKRGFLSFVTNAVMPNDNPKKNGKFRKGPINVIHDRRTSFFGLLWKCSQDGMSSAMMGIDQQKDKPDENVVIKVIKKVFKPLQRKKQLKKDLH
jgi:hypothetical protein